MSRDIRPDYSKNRVNKAGKKVKSGTETAEDIEVIENLRACHNHILNTWQSTLRGRIKSPKITFAQRLKRRITIYDKLNREPTMALANMHDIAGCRLIFPDIKTLKKYRNSLHKNNRFKHELYKAGEDPYNYIDLPAPSGYRGIHDVYIYKASRVGGQYWNGLKVEIQYRTIYQHAWATAVEVAGSITGNQSKFDKGSEDQKEFFKLASEIISRAYEGLPSCYPKLSNAELIKNFDKLENKINLLRYMETIRTVSTKFPVEGKTLILKLTQNTGGSYETEIHSFKSLPQATKAYFELEKTAKENEDLVLVRAGSNESIRNAYRNYFSDTGDFVQLIKTGLKKLKSL